MVIDVRKAFAAALTYELDKGEWGLAKELAEAIGIKPTYISMIKLGKRHASEAVRRKIADFFECDYETFIERGALLMEGRALPEEFEESGALKSIQEKIRIIFESDDLEAVGAVVGVVNLAVKSITNKAGDDDSEE